MTLVQTHANGFGTPSLPQLLLTAMLRVLAELVLNVVSTLQMIRRPDRVNATRATSPGLPRETSDTNQETISAAQHRSPKALMLRSAAKLLVSKHAGVLTTVSHKLAQHERPIHIASSSLRSSRRKSGPRAARMMRATGLLMQPWIPAFAGKSGLVSPPNKNAAA